MERSLKLLKTAGSCVGYCSDGLHVVVDMLFVHPEEGAGSAVATHLTEVP